MMSMAEVDSMVTGLRNIGDVGDDDDEDDEDLSDIDDDDLLGELEVCETEHLTCCCSLTILCVFCICVIMKPKNHTMFYLGPFAFIGSGEGCTYGD